MAVESLPLPLGASLPTMPTRALMVRSSPERYRAAIAIAAASVFVTGVGTVYLDAQANRTQAAPAVRIAGPVTAAVPAQAVAVAAPSHDAGPLRRFGAGTATDISEPVLGPIVSPSTNQSGASHWQSVARARSTSVATTSSGARVYANSSSSSTASSSTVSSTSSSSSRYLVRAGDDFGAIGARFGISADRVAALNPGVDSTQLSIGQSLHVG